MFKKRIVLFLTDTAAIIYFFIKKACLVLRCSRKNTLRILVYHSIAPERDLPERNISIDLFRQQMALLKKTKKNLVSLAQGIDALEKGALLKDSIAITFDDGLQSAYHEAAGVLEDFKIPATFFIIYHYVDNQKVQEPDVFTQEEFMNWDMVLSLKEKGFAIGSHSYSHQRLKSLKNTDLDREIAYAKQEFEKKGLAVEFFSYPYGSCEDFSEATEARIRQAGYKACVTNIMGDNSTGDNVFRLKRTRVSWRDNAFRFRLKINGAYDWLDTLKYILLRKSNRY